MSHRPTSLAHRDVTPPRGCVSVLETKAPRGGDRRARAIDVRLGTGALGRGGHSTPFSAHAPFPRF